MVEIAGFYDETAEASTSYDPIPAGEYRAKIIESEVEPVSKQSDKGNCLKLTWKVEGGPFDGRLIWQRLNMWFSGAEKEPGKVAQIANQQFASIREATGVLTPRDTVELHERPCTIKVVINTDPTGRYQPSNEIKGVKDIGSAAPASANAPAPRQAAPAAGAAAPRDVPWPRKTG